MKAGAALAPQSGAPRSPDSPMTEVPDTEGLIALGVFAMFGSLLVHGVVAAVVARVRKSFEAGLAMGMVLFGLTGLAIAASLAWVLFVLSAEVAARPAGCEDLQQAGEPTLPVHRQFFIALAASDGGWRTRLATAPLPGRCPAAEVALAAAAREREEPGTDRARNSSSEAPVGADGHADDAAATHVVLRYRRAAQVSAEAPVPAERVGDPRQAPVAVGVFAAFGGFWFLAGLTMVASRRESALPQVVRAVSAVRTRWSTTFTVIGNLLAVGCIVGASFTDWDAERSTRFAFRGVALACIFFAAALALRRRLTLSMALTLLVIGGGFALAAWSLEVLG